MAGQRLWPDGNRQSRQTGILRLGRFAHRPAGHPKSQRGEGLQRASLGNNEEPCASTSASLQLAERSARAGSHGPLAAQVGSHTVYIPLFVRGGDL